MDSLGLGNLVGSDKDGLAFYVSYSRVAIYLTEILKMLHLDLAAKQEEINELSSKLSDLDELKIKVKLLKEVLSTIQLTESSRKLKKRLNPK